MKILVAEDEGVWRLWLETALASWGYDVVAVADGETAWRELQAKDAPRFLIVDWQMPGLDGIEICRRLKKDPEKRYSYIIMLTGKTATGSLVEAMQSGADDFITKQLFPEELQVRIRAGMRILELQQELLNKASHDELTGIFNRQMLMEMAVRETDRAMRENTPLSIFLLDIDFFKRINDRFGHPAGDAVLTEISKRIQCALRSIDVVGRYGGEEFMAVLPHCNLATAKQVAERVREAIASTAVDYADTQLTVTASIGVTSCVFPPVIDLHRLILEADGALYKAKNEGRNRVSAAGMQ